MKQGHNDMNTICVTGAGGTLGSEVVKQLQASGARFRGAYHSSAQLEAARARGIDAVQIDYARHETIRDAFRGCDVVFLLGPNLPDQTRLELNVVGAATECGVRHVVKQSVMGADGAPYSLSDVHRPVELALEASHLTWTLLRPNSFVQNVMTFMAPSIRAEGVFYSATGGAKISHVDVRDIAAVAVKALTEPGHEGKAYTLTGPEALSYDELANALSQALGSPVRHMEVPREALWQALVDEGAPAVIADRMLDLERYFREGHAALISDDIARVTGREPRRFSQYAREIGGSLR